jgi:hypothetical protein
VLSKTQKRVHFTLAYPQSNPSQTRRTKHRCFYSALSVFIAGLSLDTIMTVHKRSN